MKENIIFIFKILSNRITILFVFICLMFYILVVRLFQLQIIDGYTYQNELKLTTLLELSLPAPRGIIYDKFGRPLATNTSAFSIKIDPSIKIDTNIYDYNAILYELAVLLENNNENYIDDFPISVDEPYEFLFGYDPDKKKEIAWKNNMALTNSDNSYIDYTAEETFNILRDYFDISPEYTNSEARKILSIRTSLFMQRFVRYNSVTIATNVSDETVAVLREEESEFPSIYVDIDSLRNYPQGPYFAHIIGYTGKISQDELDSLNAGLDEKYIEETEIEYYSSTDTVGKSGLERSMEEYLRGESGSTLIEVDNLRRPVRVVDLDQSTQGEEIFLTIDQDLQKEVYHIIENALKNVLIGKLENTVAGKDSISLSDLFSSFITSNHILSIEKIWTSPINSTSYEIKERIIDNYEEYNENTIEDTDKINEIREIISQEIEKNNISSYEILLIFAEQGIIEVDSNIVMGLKNKTVNPLDIVIDKINSNEITPQMVNLDPSTASAIVIDVDSGAVLASVGYPTYDTNYLVNTVDANYLNLLYNDETRPLLNRPFMESRAPGSTFKMITAIAGLETDTITPTTQILDEYTFTKAGYPHANCNSYHGVVDVAGALEVSCNYFFFETAFRLGNAQEDTTLNAIETLDNYMIEFGLNDRTGVEIGELADSTKVQMSNLLENSEEDEIYIISSPEFKEFSTKRFSSDPNSVSSSTYLWRDGDTRNTSIGQAYNDYSVASMGKYMATLASHGERYQLYLINKIKESDGSSEQVTEPNLEHVVTLKDSTWEALFEGMENVVSGSKGTARTVFANFPIEVAGKTGTAEESSTRSSHNSFGCFAPIDEPKIAIYVSVPFGDTKTTSSPSAIISREILSYYFGLNTDVTPPISNNTLVK